MVIRNCPTCGSKRVKYVVEEYMAKLGRHRVLIPAIRRLRCYKCGEQCFDAGAARAIDRGLEKDSVWQARRRALFQRLASKRSLAA